MISVEQKLHSVCAHLLIGKAYLWPLALSKPSIQVKILSWFKRNFNGSGERWTKRSLIQCYRRCISEIMTHTIGRLGLVSVSLSRVLNLSPRLEVRSVFVYNVYIHRGPAWWIMRWTKINSSRWNVLLSSSMQEVNVFMEYFFNFALPPSAFCS